MNERQWALITGASSGLGEEFARHLAARKINLVLAARREAPMQELAGELRQKHGVEIVIEQMDRSVIDAPRMLQQHLDKLGISPDILINNAAFGLSGEFITQDPGRLRGMLQVDVMSLVELTHVFGSRMVARGKGHILLVASLAAYQPTHLLAAYGAAKHFVLAFGEALNVELSPKVGVTVVSPGLMDTVLWQNTVSRFISRKKQPEDTEMDPVEALRSGRTGIFLPPVRIRHALSFANHGNDHEAANSA